MKLQLALLFLISHAALTHSNHHHRVNGTLETGLGYYTVFWNTLELGLHSAELLGYKGGCSHGCGHHHGTLPEQLYHGFEIATHALNSFETTAHLSDEFSDWISSYVSPALTSAVSIVANTGIVAYRAKDLRRGIRTSTEERRLLPAMMSAWYFADMLGHLSAIYFGVQDQLD